MSDFALIFLLIALLMYLITQAKDFDMKHINQRKYEAKKRREEVARKTKKLGLTQAGNVKTSFGRNTKEYLLNMGFYQKGEENKPSKTAWAEKRLGKNVVEIEVRKK